MKISYAILACNEHEELSRLLSFLLENKRKEDEVIVVLDGNATAPVFDVIAKYEKLYDLGNLMNYTRQLENDFASQKNFLNEMCTGEWIFQIDADELPHEFLMSVLPDILESNPTIDLFKVPRINTVKGLTQDHVNKWGWVVNAVDGDVWWINWPDYQTRIYRNKPEIEWKNKVHEVITGYKKYADLPLDETYALYHHKDIRRQEMQNKRYSKI